MNPSGVTTIEDFQALCYPDGPPWPGWPQSCLEHGLSLPEAAERLARFREGFGELLNAMHNWICIEMTARPTLTYGQALRIVRDEHFISYLAACDEQIVLHPAGLPAGWHPQT